LKKLNFGFSLAPGEEVIDIV
jgi:hypothetical protein